MSDLVSELNQLDFSNYIGGPLQAAVEAQHAASMSLVEFIQEVGFEETTDDDGNTQKDLRYVDFTFNKESPNPNLGDEDAADGVDTTSPTITQAVTVKVPFLTMLVMPALRVDEINIDFNAKLTSSESRSASSEFEANAELKLRFPRVRFKASASYKRSTQRNTTIEKTYNMGVKVRAVNDELPEGLNRILNLLEDNIKAA